MRLSSILCLLALVGLPSVIRAQPGQKPTDQNQTPPAAAGAPAPAAAAPAAGAAAPAPAAPTTPAEPAGAPAASSEAAPAEPAQAPSTPAAEGSAPVSTPEETKPATPAAAEPAPELTVPSPGELGDRLVGDLPPPPEQKAGWTAPSPILTLHGYLRVRGELMDRFWLGRAIVNDEDVRTGKGPDPFSRFRPIERYTANTMCGDEDVGSEAGLSSICKGKTLQFASMRFRFAPQLNLSEDIRIKTTFDILDNYVLGDGPQSYYGAGTVANAAFPGTSNPTLSSLSGNLIVPRRVWAEVRNRDLGELRFGLMPDHWGLGMLYNAGNGLDDDYSSDLGRVMGTTKLAGFYLSAAYDFLNEGMLGTGSGIDRPGYDASQLEDLDQFTFSVVRRVPDEDEEAVLARGDVLLNGGARFQLRHQDSIVNTVKNKATGMDDRTVQNLDATIYTPDVWAQLRYGKLRLEFEAAWIVGHLRNIHDQQSKQYVSQFGAAFESELRLLNDKLGLYIYAGGATGDSEVDGVSSDANYIDHANVTASKGADSTNNSRVSTFRFHPAYRVDLILWRSIMRQVTGAMYVKPGIGYDFVKDSFGQLFGARVDMIYSRASSPVQTWGNDPNLGVEIDAQVYWRSADGPNHNDGYHAALQYGVLFPMKGLAVAGQSAQLATAQTLRLVLGVVY